VPGIIVTIAAFTLIDFDKPDYKLFDNFDFAASYSWRASGALEYVLEEGPRNDWFNDDSVLLSRGVGLSMIAFFVRMFTARQPIVDLKAFADRNFALGEPVLLHHGHRPLRLTLLLSALSRHGARLRRTDDRETMFVSGLAMFLTRGRGTADRQGRSARQDDGGIRILRDRNVVDDVPHRRLGFPRAVLASGLSRVGLMLAMIPINNISLGRCRRSG